LKAAVAFAKLEAWRLRKRQSVRAPRVLTIKQEML
jgi:hypothetical protein